MTERNPRVPVIGVIGSAGQIPAVLASQCIELGGAIMEAGFRLVTGGRDGVMRDVSRGARQSAAWREGRILGIVPSYRSAEANEFCDIVIPTGMQLARNILVVAASDVVVAVDGGAGTLSEMAMAWQLERPIVALGATGWAGKLAGTCVDARSRESIVPATTVEEAIARCRELIGYVRDAGGVGDGWRSQNKDRP